MMIVFFVWILCGVMTIIQNPDSSTKATLIYILIGPLYWIAGLIFVIMMMFSLRKGDWQ